MRQGSLLCALAMTGCSFSQSNGVDLPDGAGPTARGCRVAPGLESDLRLCLELEDEAPMTIARDSSGLANDATATAVGTAMRSPLVGGNEQAARFTGPDSKLSIAADGDLDLQEVTIEMFVQLDPIANGRRYWLLDNSGQYFMSYGEDREVRCGINDTTAIDSGTDVIDIEINDTNWHHVACTYDRTQLRVFVDGSVADCRDTTEALVPAGPGGTTIGARTNGMPNEHLSGAIDSVHVFARALTPAQICAASGQTTCELTCPPKDDGGPGGGGPGGD